MTVKKRGCGHGDARRKEQESGPSGTSPAEDSQRTESRTAKWRHADGSLQPSRKDHKSPSTGIDPALIAAAKTGDTAAMNLLLLELEPCVDRVVRAYQSLLATILPDEDDAKQETLTKFCRKLGSFRGDESRLRSWLARMAARTIHDLVRRGRRLLPRTSSGPRQRVDLETPSTEADPALIVDPRRDSAPSWEDRQLVGVALAALKESDRRVLDMCVCQEVPYSAAAARLGLPTADAARMRCARALNRLRWQLRSDPFARRGTGKGACA